MYYFLANFPKINYKKINAIRKQYDSNYSFIDPHIAIFFPVDASIGEENLINHIDSVLQSSNTKTFKVTLSGIKKSWDHYMYLLVEQGRQQIINLHDQMYTELLAPFLIKEAGYTPHITLGFFANKQAKFDKSDIKEVVFFKDKYEAAVKQAQELNLFYTFILDQISLIKRNDKHSNAVIIKNFKF